ncbi:MAG: tRNA dihydrouridine(20/20a) synthase DusA [Persicimonas sp.]
MSTAPKANPLSIAPMMRRTDRRYRYMMRLMTRRTLLYTEMVHTREVLDSNRERALGFDEEEKPLSLQLGGDDPEQMAECARIAEGEGFDEVNINVGCPSNRVQHGNFGVCLMGQPEVVAACVEAMQAAVDIPVTVKHRIGFDDQDSFEEMARFVRVVADAGCRRFTVHARKAWLDGLSPRENRNVPPLRYEEIYRLKSEFPGLFIEINGGIETLDEVEEHLEKVDAAMLGRAAYETPYIFAKADRRIYGEDREPPTRHEVVERMLPYIERRLTCGDKLAYITKHMLHLFAYQPGASRWRRHLSENAHRDDAGVEVVEEALELVPRD